MPTATIDGLRTRYDVVGSGPPLLMFSPGGFDATLDKWSTLGVYERTRMLDHLSATYSCITFDRREAGESAGRIESITWTQYVEQGRGLLDHLGITRAHLIGGCMGCAPVLAFGVAHPAMTRSMVLYWPVGGAKYRINSHQRLTDHLTYVQEHGLAAVVALVRKDGKPFGADPRGGPWASALKHDNQLADVYASMEIKRYEKIIADLGRSLFDRDTAPGAEPEDLLGLDIPALIVPGHDASHATSAARYLEECLPRAEYWDVPVDGQTEDTVPPKLLGFLDQH